MSSHLFPPGDNELEVSLFGPGYGEAIAVHIGKGQWFLVDSCEKSNPRKPASLDYLEKLGVDISNGVKMVVVTHWHDDHVRGISEIVRHCQSANVVISDAVHTEALQGMMAYYRLLSTSGNSGVEELSKILGILEERRGKGVRFNAPERAKANQILFKQQIDVDGEKVLAEIWALSPSAAEVNHASLSLADLIPTTGTREKRIASPKYNHTSVALWCHIGEHRMLFGADVEARADPTTGWTSILDDSRVLKKTSNGTLVRLCPLFKVSHHGARSGHEQRVWEELLIEEPYAIMTPYNRGGTYLPDDADIARITRITSKAYITTLPSTKRTKYRHPVVRDFLRDFVEEIHNVEPGFGQIRLRCSIGGPANAWKVELFGAASKL